MDQPAVQILRGEEPDAARYRLRIGEGQIPGHGRQPQGGSQSGAVTYLRNGSTWGESIGNRQGVRLGGIRAAQHIGQQGTVQPHKKEIAEETIFRNYNPALNLQRYFDDKDRKTF